ARNGRVEGCRAAVGAHAVQLLHPPAARRSGRTRGRRGPAERHRSRGTRPADAARLGRVTVARLRNADESACGAGRFSPRNRIASPDMETVRERETGEGRDMATGAATAARVTAGVSFAARLAFDDVSHEFSPG